MSRTAAIAVKSPQPERDIATRAIPALSFRFDGDAVTSRVALGRQYESHPGIVHGGIVATILDEVMAQAAGQALSGHVVTVSLRIRYIAPMATDRDYRAEARVLSAGEEIVEVGGELIGDDLIAAATATFRALARRRDTGQ